MSDVLVEVAGPITTVIINRPHTRNAVDGPTAAALLRAFEAFESDDEQRVAVLCGAGGTFCSGADLLAIGTSLQNRLEAAAGEKLPKKTPTKPWVHLRLLSSVALQHVVTT